MRHRKRGTGPYRGGFPPPRRRAIPGAMSEKDPAQGGPRLPLAGLRVVELGHYIAAPFATRLLADLGAEVIKVEPPEGDPVRGWGSAVNGNAVWFSVHGRNKLSVTLDLK